MNKKIKLIPLKLLKPHERIFSVKKKILIQDFKKRGIIINPVVADRKTFVILDGHHRVAALKQMGIKNIPVYLVAYPQKKVRVFRRRKKYFFNDIKKAVISSGLSGALFPQKSTRHLIQKRPRNINVKLIKLK